MAIDAIPGWVDKLRSGERLNGTLDAYASVPMLYRAVNLRCDAIGSVPYTLKRNGEIIDWPWRQSLSSLINQTERALLLTGAAFWLRIVDKNVLTGFMPLNPTTISVNFDITKSRPGDPFAGVTFTQTMQANSAVWNIDQVVYWREPSMTDDIGPGLAPARVALQSAQLSHYLERFASAFFEGGAQPVTIMNLPVDMEDTEFKRFQGEFGQRISGIMNSFRALFVRAPDMKMMKLTPDINTMMLPELQERVITSIAMTLGVPRTMLEASAANFATADSDRQSFWRETIIPRLELYEHILNNQLFSTLGYAINFEPEKLDVMQADEAARAGSLKLLVDAGVPLRGAMTILGYDYIDEAIGPPANEVIPQTPPLPEGSGTSIPVSEIVNDLPTGIMPNASTRSIDIDAEWHLYQKKIERRIKSGRTPRCDFSTSLIDSDSIKSVSARLYDGISINEVIEIISDVKAVDDLTDDERRLFDKIAPQLQKRGEVWARQIVQGKQPDPSLRDVVAPAVTEELTRVMTNRIDRLGTQFSLPQDNADGVVLDWLADYMPQFNTGLDATTQNLLSKIIAQYRTTPGMTIDNVIASLRPAFDKSRARAIAITEITRAASQATIEYQTYLASKGLLYERIWNTDADELVCPICVPLNNKGEDVWIAEYPSGPPAHVRCRCDTTLRRVRE
jgi:HK97 family phage portal protein